MTTVTRPLAATGSCLAVVLFATACASTAATAGSSGGVSTPSTSTSASPSTSPTAPTTAPPVTTTTTVYVAPPISSQTQSAPQGCKAADLTVATWKPVPGSGAAGSTSSDIAFENTSNHACAISGFPQFTLYDAEGALPTHVTYNPIPTALLLIAPGSWFHSELRYSSDIPGPGEPVSGPCEPAATYALAQMPGDPAKVHVTLASATSVCEKGTVEAKPFASGASSPAGG